MWSSSIILGDAILATVFTTVLAAVSATISGAVFTNPTGAATSSKRGENAGWVKGHGQSCQEQDNCNYYKFIHHLSSCFSNIAVKDSSLLFIIHCDIIINEHQ
jgi:hypothetical protein